MRDLKSELEKEKEELSNLTQETNRDWRFIFCATFLAEKDCLLSPDIEMRIW